VGQHASRCSNQPRWRPLDAATCRAPTALVSLARSREGTKLNDVAVAGLAAMVDDRPFVFAGDWNISRIPMEERDRTAAAVFFDRIAGHRWRDCVWDRTKAELRTWFRNSESDDQGLRQNDHVFCSLDHFDRMAADAWVATDASTVLGLSDHARLIVEFDVLSIGLTNLKSLLRPASRLTLCIAPARRCGALGSRRARPHGDLMR
jgi:hypothetical protein